MDVSHSDRAPLELWGGIECTCNRVGDAYFDQVRLAGHDRRPEDLERLAKLGICTVRYPALWEWAATGDPARFDWTWADGRLPRLRQLGLRPIVGLVHHGSGPRHTSLVESSFAPGLAEYARQFAERFPWVVDYTPVNEPLTTARFSALYGHWYPHLRDDRAFATALLNQCRATVQAMQAIRRVQPQARLVQTEDLGKTYSTPALAYQAQFDNERRWLTFDLLMGRVDRRHSLGQYFLWLGVPEQELLWFRENPCPPDIVGVNYYVTSERFLDERLERYPPRYVGGNHRQRYVDVEAVRARPEGLAGVARLLAEASDRYRLPLAVTEAHLGCFREEQVRWLAEIWQEAQAARSRGAHVLAVTAWSLLGAFDWDSLVTQQRGHYESGAFDLRAPAPRATAVAHLIRKLARREEPNHPVLAQPGWWRRSERLLHGEPSSGPAPSPQGQPLLIAGAGGMLGSAFGRVCQLRGLSCELLDRQQLDIVDAASVEKVLERVQPWAVVNAAGYARVDRAEHEADRCYRENVIGPTILAAECQRRGLPLLAFSSDLVFGGERRQPYTESHRVNPLNVYGRTKVEAEERMLAICGRALVIRTSALFGPWDERNFVTAALRSLAANKPFRASPLVISPTYLPDLVHACLDLLVDGVGGLWHLAGEGETSWEQLARSAADQSLLDAGLVQQEPLGGHSAPRPSYSALGSERALLLPRWEDALTRYLAARGAALRGAAFVAA